MIKLLCDFFSIHTVTFWLIRKPDSTKLCDPSNFRLLWLNYSHPYRQKRKPPRSRCMSLKFKSSFNCICMVYAHYPILIFPKQLVGVHRTGAKIVTQIVSSRSSSDKRTAYTPIFIFVAGFLFILCLLDYDLTNFWLFETLYQIMMTCIMASNMVYVFGTSI